MNKTVRTAETERAQADPLSPENLATDLVGAAVETAARCCDALVVTHALARIAGSLWREASEHSSAHLSRVMLPPVVTTDVSAAESEAYALASDGLRVAVMAEFDQAPPMAPTTVPPRPLVRYVLGSDAADSGGLFLDARSPQEVIDAGIIAYMAAARSLCPVTVRLSADLALARFERIEMPTREQLSELLGGASDDIASPNSFQKSLFGKYRKRLPVDWPADIDVGRLQSGGRKILAQATEEYNRTTGRAFGGPEAPDEGEAESDAGSNLRLLRACVASTRAFAAARELAEVVASTGVTVFTTGRPTDQQTTMQIGRGASPDAGEFDVLISPGQARQKLASVVGALRKNGSLLLEAPSGDPEKVWTELPDAVKNTVREREIRVFAASGDQPTRFASSAVQFLLLAREDRLPATPEPVASERAATNGEQPSSVVEDVAALREVPWTEFKEEADFYADDRSLRLDVSAEPEPSDEVRGRMMAFHHTGRDFGSRIDDSGLVPAHLFPYVYGPSISGPYPLVLPTDPAARSRPLSAVIGELAAPDDKEPELRSRLARKMETAVVGEHKADPSVPVSTLWNRAARRLLGSASGDEEKDVAAAKALEDLRGLVPDGRLLGYGPDSPRSILKHVVDREWAERFGPIREDAAGLAVLMEEFLRADFSGSPEGHDPEHLRASVGKGYADELDFDALSRLVDETSVAEPLPGDRRRRLQSAARDLKQLPAQLTTAQQNGVLAGPDGLVTAVARTHENLRVVASLIRAIRIALLESSGGYREEFHDRLFAQFGVQHLSDEERALCPPYIVDLGSSSALSRTSRGALVEVLGTDLPVKVLLTVDRLPTGLGDSDDADPSITATSRLAMQAVSLGTAFVFQAPASCAESIIDAAVDGTRFHGPALYSLFGGSSTTISGPGEYLSAAVALESRAFPVFQFDPSGTDWADRFSVAGNPMPERAWGYGEVSYSNPQSQDEVLETAFTFADYLSLDPDVADHFRRVLPSDWQPEMIPVDEFVDLTEVDAAGRVPFLWMADEHGRLHRVLVTYPITDAVRRAQRGWRTLQELGGIDSSFARRIIDAERAELEDERDRLASEAEDRLRAELDKTTGEVARNIVSNIAAGLLGLRTAGPVTTLSPEPVTDSAAAIEPADVVDVEPEETEEEEDTIVLDEPYIETPRCTSCNECTNLNSLMFAYDENKQAYIKDTSAGTFRDLVVAAEKCPVRIIHPGKPLDPDETGVEDLIQRAQPFQ